MILHEIPKYPWQIVAADMFYLNGDDYAEGNDSNSTNILVLHWNQLDSTLSEVIKKGDASYIQNEIDQFSRVYRFYHVTINCQRW